VNNVQDIFDATEQCICRPGHNHKYMIPTAPVKLLLITLHTYEITIVHLYLGQIEFYIITSKVLLPGRLSSIYNFTIPCNVASCN